MYNMEIDIIEANVPLLLVLDFMDRFNVTIDTENNVLSQKKLETPSRTLTRAFMDSMDKSGLLF